MKFRTISKVVTKSLQGIKRKGGKMNQTESEEMRVSSGIKEDACVSGKAKRKSLRFLIIG